MWNLLVCGEKTGDLPISLDKNSLYGEPVTLKGGVCYRGQFAFPR